MLSISTATFILLFLIGILGISLGYLLRFLQMTVAKAQLEVNVRKTLNKARDKASKIVAEAYQQTDTIRQDLDDKEIELKNREQIVAKAEDRIAKLESNITTEQAKLDTIYQTYQKKLQSLSTTSEIESLESDLKTALVSDLETEYRLKTSELESNYEQKLTALVTDHLPDITRRTIRNSTGVTFNVASSEIGKIIGKDGTNIKALERYGGVDVVIDDVASTVTISSFNPKRRLVAKQAVIELLDDGRVNRDTISETLIDVETRIKSEAIKLIKRGLRKLLLDSHPSIDDEIIDLLVELNYRTSYGQNQLEHSLEVAEIAGMIMSDFNESEIINARLAGLLHDIGKVIDDENTDHVASGLGLLRNKQIDTSVINAIAEHHQPHATTLLSAILQTADTVSSGRPGARSESTSSYYERLQSIEKFIENYDGVDNAYAVSGGKVINVIIQNNHYAREPLRNIATVISEDLKQSGLVHQPVTIKIIREEQFSKKVA